MAVNKRISGAYADLFRGAPNHFLWAGLAAFASDEVGLGLKVTGMIADGLLVPGPDPASVLAQRAEQLFTEGNRAVFNDIYWQHIAYQSYGLAEIQRMYDEDDLGLSVLAAWTKIDAGVKQGDQTLIIAGNNELLFYEQDTILQPIYDKYPALAAMLSPFMFSPVPGLWSPFQASVPFGNIGIFSDRWKWVASSVLPDWDNALKNDIDNINQHLENLESQAKEVCP